jgi:hypothetical protein
VAGDFGAGREPDVAALGELADDVLVFPRASRTSVVVGVGGDVDDERLVAARDMYSSRSSKISMYWRGVRPKRIACGRSLISMPNGMATIELSPKVCS